MLVEDVVSYLEMKSPQELRPARDRGTEVELREVSDVDTIRAVHDRVAGPYGWMSLAWTAEKWRESLDRPGVRTWVPRIDGADAGFALLCFDPGGDVEIDFFGLAPEFTGRGLGGHFLTVVTRTAWEAGATRVWLRTSSYDHPHARASYEARGFRLFKTETRERELVTP
ncbi:GNAT family N-acetyltransferase [Lentzea sp. NPDC051208]|uniref:GNAT family N-acetyltransferase n=1 Tax=Lentzea sp. NPDC051208 TaxID=3154642 RepID=UPI003434D3B0